MNGIVRKLRLDGLVLLLGVAGAGALRAQDPRDSLVARADSELEATRRLQLLIRALNPTLGPLRGTWSLAVQDLVQTLIESGQDSVAGVWMRWAVRRSPDLRPDTLRFLPQVVAAYRSAHDFVIGTRGSTDSLAATAWLWPAQETSERVGWIEVAATQLAVPLQVQVKGNRPVSAGGIVPLNPGSYLIIASAVGYDSVRVTREVLPGVTTVLDFHPRSVMHPKRKHFPLVLAALGAGGVTALLLIARPSPCCPPPPTGSITVTLPSNP
jgi:hypothetical protein